jgi:hypothetical protein
MHRLRRTQQHRADRDVVTRCRLEQAVRDVRRIDVRQDQQVRVAFERRFGQRFAAQVGVECDVTMPS